jgi:hypothetical protein
MIDIPPYIVRRIEFLLSEARAGDPVRDQTITYAMRVVSNYCAIGRDAGSSAIKRNYHRMSKRALQLKNELTPAEWVKLTINEHQEPLNLVWTWILQNKDQLSAQDVIERFRKFPMVIITKKENDQLSKLGFGHRGDPVERYKKAKIEVLEVAPADLPNIPPSMMALIDADGFEAD